MNTPYLKLNINSNDYFIDNNLYTHINTNYIKFNSLWYAQSLVDKIPEKITYSIDHDNIFESCPTPNPYGYKLFRIENKTNEKLKIFFKINGKISKNKIKIKLDTNFILNITEKTIHELYLMCTTSRGIYFVNCNSICNYIHK